MQHFILLCLRLIGIHQMELPSSLGYLGVMAARQNVMFNMTLPSRFFIYYLEYILFGLIPSNKEDNRVTSGQYRSLHQKV